MTKSPAQVRLTLLVVLPAITFLVGLGGLLVWNWTAQGTPKATQDELIRTAIGALVIGSIPALIHWLRLRGKDRKR